MGELIGYGEGRISLAVQTAGDEREKTVAKEVECTCYCVHNRFCFTVAKLRRKGVLQNTMQIVFFYHNDGRDKYPNRVIVVCAECHYLCSYQSV